ncbi:MAG: penicillin-binding protein 2 [Candidatus Sungbacteria bacterium]|uniref:Penicillin-binding protein 2 n=1 Tax=Candidatus Sungiibacteriota bacterium TaxID=2750080 RepID=A0A932YZ86_9BACT|nr:penicillin-binding protein 2 [Candidatus Sungbacteria bacterium]
MRWSLSRQLKMRRNAVEIEPEEIFMDAANIPGFREELLEGRIERPIARRTFVAFSIMVLLGFLVVAGRLVELQLVRGAAFLREAQANKTYPILIQAPRGIFYDRNFEKLVENTPTFVISLKTQAIPSDEEFERLMAELSRLTDRAISEIADANGVSGGEDVAEFFPRSVWPEEVVVASGELRGAVLEIQSRPEDFPGVVIIEASRRNYLLGAASSHVLGYVGRPSREDLVSRPEIRPTDIIGKTGFELVYDASLRGSSGEKLIEVNAAGQALRERFLEKPQAGSDLVLELDAGLQQQVHEALARHLRALGKKAGAVVVVDPRDGAVRALVNYPDFDPNIFGGGNRKELERLRGDASSPFFDRAISGGYPSGSTIKPILAVAALEERIIDPGQAIYDPGYIEVPNPYDPNRPTIFKDWKELGWVDMKRALALSANVYFYTVGGGYRDIKGLGIERIGKFLERFGWGSPLGIDLPGEYGGLIPNPENKKTIRPRDPVWRIGDTYLTSIGQGDVQVTPLQLAVSTAAIANGGTLWKPRLARAVVDEERRVRQEFRPEVIRAGIASPESLKTVREGMRQAVTIGSASSLADLSPLVAGKTGTAQTGVYGKNHGWFVGFAPYENPEVVIAVLVEEGTGGSTDAVPIAKEILYYYFTAQNSPPLTPLEARN